MALDHPVERFSIDGKNTRGCLLVSAGVIEYASDVTTFDFRQRDPLFAQGLIRNLVGIRELRFTQWW